MCSSADRSVAAHLRPESYRSSVPGNSTDISGLRRDRPVGGGGGRRWTPISLPEPPSHLSKVRLELVPHEQLGRLVEVVCLSIADVKVRLDAVEGLAEALERQVGQVVHLR